MTDFSTLDGGPPLVFGHRGASGLRPEHTLEAYALAIAQGADLIEPDLVPTRDGVLLARHENEIGGTTDVATRPEFADRRTTKIIDGQTFSGWFTEDFTLAEIKTLYARERIPGIRPDNTAFDDLFRIPTLAEVIDLVQRTEAETGRRIGIAPETKHPTFFEFAGEFVGGGRIGIDTSRLLVDTLVAEGFTDPGRVVIQSFELANLIALQTAIMPAAGIDLPLVQLLGGAADIAFNLDPANTTLGADPAIYRDFAFPLTAASATNADLYSAEAFRAMTALYAEVISPPKSALTPAIRLTRPVDADGDGAALVAQRLTGAVNPLVENAHAAGAALVVYTLRDDEAFQSLNPDETVQLPVQEYLRYIALGVDGFFTDFPGSGRAVVDQLVAGDRAVALANRTGGNDIAVLDADGLVAAKGSAGRDLAVFEGAGNVALPDTVEDLRLEGDADSGGVGNALANRLLGNGGDNRLVSGGGADRVNGGTGDDTLVLAGGRADWRVSIANGRADLTDLRDGTVVRAGDVQTLVFDDGEWALFAADQSEIAGLYRAYLGRDADFGGLVWWSERSAGGMGLEEIAATFAAGPEFQARLATLTVPALVDALYRDVLGRPAAQAQGGREYWIGVIERGERGPAEAALEFVRGPEFQASAARVVDPGLWLD